MVFLADKTRWCILICIDMARISPLQLEEFTYTVRLAMNTDLARKDVVLSLYAL